MPPDSQTRVVELLSREVTRSRPEKNCTVVMMCDLDHFKMVNDTHGHEADDDVLREVVATLALCGAFV